MLERFVRLYIFFFARRRLAKFNKLLYRLSLGGLGILNYKNAFASGEAAFLRSYLPSKHGVLIDVGANKGTYTKSALSTNPGLKVYALEPHPKTFSVLEQALSTFPNVVLINKGLSSSKGTVRIFDYADNDGSSHASLYSEVITEIHGAKGSTSHDIEVTTLDALVDQEQISEISLLKIDTEGNELEVLRGATKTLSAGTIRAIHFEFNEMNVASRSYFRDFWALLKGYDFYRLLPNDRLAITKYTPLSCEIFAYQNIVAINKIPGPQESP